MLCGRASIVARWRQAADRVCQLVAKYFYIVARYGAQIFRYAYRGVSDTAYRVDTRIVLKKNRGHKTLTKP